GPEVARAVQVAGTVAAQRRVPEPAEGSQPIVDRYHDHVLALREVAAVVEAGVPDRVAAAVDPDHHGQPAGRRGRARRVDVQEQAILAAGWLEALEVVDPSERSSVLHAGRPRDQRLADAVPARRRLGRAPAQRADRRRRVRDAEPRRAAVAADEADDLSAGGRAPERLVGCRTLGGARSTRGDQRQRYEDGSEV